MTRYSTAGAPAKTVYYDRPNAHVPLSNIVTADTDDPFGRISSSRTPTPPDSQLAPRGMHIRDFFSQYSPRVPVEKDACLGPFSHLPDGYEALASYRILLLVSGINSFTQRLHTWLTGHLKFKHVSVQIMISDKPGETAGRDAALEAYKLWMPDLVICPFLMAMVPPEIYNNCLTLVVHPGPPGDAGPSALDWLLLGDKPANPDLSAQLGIEVLPSKAWGCIVFKATENFDAGPVWAWEQYPMPWLGTITKSQLYGSLHSSAAMIAIAQALLRVYYVAKSEGVENDSSKWHLMGTHIMWYHKTGSDFDVPRTGPVGRRPLLPAKARVICWQTMSGNQILRLIHASDTQPGASIDPPTPFSKTSLFVYGAHVHHCFEDFPEHISDRFLAIYGGHPKPGSILCTRNGAVCIKTRNLRSADPYAIWLTHARVKKPLGAPIEPKIPFIDALMEAGHGRALGVDATTVKEGKKKASPLVGFGFQRSIRPLGSKVPEWEGDVTSYKALRGTWSDIWVETVDHGHAKVIKVFWDFYNGAFTTDNCKRLLKALKWAADRARGNVRAIVLMGGHYFSNGIALNTIEHRTQEDGSGIDNNREAAREAYENITAMNDIVEFLIGDTHYERTWSPDGLGKRPQTLCGLGIVTVACIRGNAAAGGVALAAACDVVLCARGAVLNPSYRAMGLHGSEFHSFSYAKRCGRRSAERVLGSMMPWSGEMLMKEGVVDHLIGNIKSSLKALDDEVNKHIDYLLSPISYYNRSSRGVRFYACAPWVQQLGPANYAGDDTVAEAMAANKYSYFQDSDRDVRKFPPVVHYRNEEMRQMLQDFFDPLRSMRFHSRRRAFIRKSRSTHTPIRYAPHRMMIAGWREDEECRAAFDRTELKGPRGFEWAIYLNTCIPSSLETSAFTLINRYQVRSWKRQPTEDHRALCVEIHPERLAPNALYSPCPVLFRPAALGSLGFVNPDVFLIAHPNTPVLRGKSAVLESPPMITPILGANGTRGALENPLPVPAYPEAETTSDESGSNPKGVAPLPVAAAKAATPTPEDASAEVLESPGSSYHTASSGGSGSKYGMTSRYVSPSGSRSSPAESENSGEQGPDVPSEAAARVDVTSLWWCFEEAEEPETRYVRESSRLSRLEKQGARL